MLGVDLRNSILENKLKRHILPISEIKEKQRMKRAQNFKCFFFTSNSNLKYNLKNIFELDCFPKQTPKRHDCISWWDDQIRALSAGLWHYLAGLPSLATITFIQQFFMTCPFVFLSHDWFLFIIRCIPQVGVKRSWSKENKKVWLNGCPFLCCRKI